MRKAMKFIEKGMTLAAVLAVFTLVISVAWGANNWDSATGTLTIVDPLAEVQFEHYMTSGIAQTVASLNSEDAANIVSDDIKIVIIKPSATPVIKSTDDLASIDLLLYHSGGGIITWEDMRYLAELHNLKSVDMRGANTLYSPFTVLDVAAGDILYNSLEEMYLPEGIAIISKDSFSATNVLPAIKKIVFPSTLEVISADTFKGIGTDPNSITLVFTGPTAPVIAGSAFSGGTSEKIGKVIVPQESSLDYAGALGSTIAGKISYVESITAVPTTLPSDGGTVDVTVAGKNLDKTFRIAVKGTLLEKEPVPGAVVDSWVVSGVSIPGNTTSQPVTYKITSVLDGVTVPGVSADVTVAAAARQLVSSPDQIISVDVEGNKASWIYRDTPTVVHSLVGTESNPVVFKYPERMFDLTQQSIDTVVYKAGALLIPNGVSLDVTFTPISGGQPITIKTRTQVNEDNDTYFEIPLDTLTTGNYTVAYASPDNSNSRVIFEGTLEDFYYSTSSSYISMFAWPISGKGGIAASAKLVPPGAVGTPVTFRVSRSQSLVTEVPGITDASGSTGSVTLVADGLPYGNYTVTATASGYDSSSAPVNVGGGDSSDTGGGGCSAVTSPLLLIAGATVMAWTSKRR
ncbi:MAG: hypothetical protein LBL73_01185 [Synergistaceae bacterium]|jgi:hypothetical protein|nr:hypothetical protein [Synergistaceae bacterium]